ncbi:MAG: hypothetical protein M1834_002833 [Cirrosporium novae-zelandiae]|nr:MAG: hypothetical protein M1834_002833 [Cirrosporium novae-zelandiae]
MATPSNSPPSQEAEDDYMTMAIVEPVRKEKETYTQRRIRKQRESEAKSRQPTKAERAAQEKARLDEALSNSLPTSSKGFAMLSKLGYKPGTALGKAPAPSSSSSSSADPLAKPTPQGLIEPIKMEMKEGRGGIGLDSERKRKAVEELQGVAKMEKAELGEYRDRVAKEREEKRLEGQVWGAMRVCEKFDIEQEEEEESQDISGIEGNADRGPAAEIGETLKKNKNKNKRKVRPTKDINVLWRGLIREREMKDREKRMRHDLLQSLSKLPTYDDPDEDSEDRRALGKTDTLEEEVEEEDPELDEYNALEPEEKLRRLVEYLRITYHYCFWCKYRYPDPDMDGCPGITEEDHD